MITNSFSNKLGGAERLVNLLHCHLRENDMHSFVLGIVIDNENTLPDSSSIGLKTPYDIRAFFSIKRYCKNNIDTNDIIHVHLFPANLYCAILKRIGYIKGELITTEHSTYNRRRNKIWGQLIDNFIYNSYDHIIAISEGVKRNLIEWIPNVTKKISVISNGCHMPLKNPIIRSAKKGTITILSIGSLSEQKNYANTLYSLREINKLDFRWLIAGEGPLKDKLIKKRDSFNLKGKVEFLGRVDPILPLLKDADIFLMASKWEGFGLAAVEAMNASLPLVASDIPGLSEVVKTNPPCALLIDPLIPDSIASNIKRLINSYDLRLQFGKRAFEHAKRFEINIMFNNYINFYKMIDKK